MRACPGYAAVIDPAFAQQKMFEEIFYKLRSEDEKVNAELFRGIAHIAEHCLSAEAIVDKDSKRPELKPLTVTYSAMVLSLPPESATSAS